MVSAYKLISQLWREEEKCGLSEIQLFKLPILALAVIKKSGYKDILKQKLVIIIILSQFQLILLLYIIKCVKV